jgi:hypothetical protein
LLRSSSFVRSTIAPRIAPRNRENTTERTIAGGHVQRLVYSVVKEAPA